ncbi:phosphotransferase family protein [Pseudalkalibacillus caeni]|uniref:Aminoglycoside phosphotransferase family protein n=1 Tax=Exobacillus caeni TaxID=2574798 RepID=A0A5R9FBI8_9BACL|nr:aminoglycoside phosphotransferase family protein [Pseudalkalibacillus caeni]TLS36985.1 aminoglycoside phosphotransferase family protein [Pseudalkalibacillus caeni]
MNDLQVKAEQIRKKLEIVLATGYKEMNVSELEIAGSGVQNVVFRGNSEHGPLAFRVPWHKEVSNINEKTFSSRLSLQKEANLSTYCIKNGIPVPGILGLHFGEELDFLISEFVAADSVPISPRKIGLTVKNLHNMPVHDLDFPNESEETLEKHIAKRLVSRMGAFNRITSSDYKLPISNDIEQILEPGSNVKRLLHMDVRPVNLIGQKGEVKAIVDWDNALIGHPLLDLMRIAETNEISWAEFIEGYGDSEISHSLPPIVVRLYRLDTAVMLANLFISQLKIQEKGRYYKKRVEVLMKEINNLL